jgi:hypothetical protein
LQHCTGIIENLEKKQTKIFVIGQSCWTPERSLDFMLDSNAGRPIAWDNWCGKKSDFCALLAAAHSGQ